MTSNENVSDEDLALMLAAQYRTLSDVPKKLTSADIFESLYFDWPCERARVVSRREREKNRYKESSLTYGEIRFDSFQEMFKVLYEYGLPETGGVFLDIGCGSGRPVFAAALIHDFNLCAGIEILDGLYEVCEEVFVTWRKTVKFQCSKKQQDTEIRFYHGDATVMSWMDADVVFANSTCFSRKLLKKLAKKTEELRPGTFFISTTYALPSPDFELLHTMKMSETWGDATVFIQRKLFPEQEDTQARREAERAEVQSILASLGGGGGAAAPVA